MTPAELRERLELARRRLEAPRARDTALETSVDETRSRLGLPVRYLDADELRRLTAQPLPGSALKSAGTGSWTDRHACPDCLSFRGASQYPCRKCNSYARPIPAHERARASAGTRARADARRRAKRKR